MENMKVEMLQLKKKKKAKIASELREKKAPLREKLILRIREWLKGGERS